jgi:hypothetical protein
MLDTDSKTQYLALSDFSGTQYFASLLEELHR